MNIKVQDSERKEENAATAGDLGRLVASLRNQIVAKLDCKLKPLDLTASQYAVIKLIAGNRADTLAQLCELTQNDRGAMSRMLCRMEAKCLIVRTPCPHDGRAFKLALTDNAWALFPQTVKHVNTVYEEALSGLNMKQREQLFSLLGHCLSNLE
ncbi:winged helix DNA-binding protein [Alteromonas pelagimontana]|uniref:Winged helix DNA-binding protein n=1 Tax=Alteromonas pelagimontana TaxID=1858656 RepID=A0A6M4MHV9_9ALTE|nr:MarR family transcriptional regulator [Alteromonas pelagimontana]QJR82508.1 winged helix DNA-binding protein [Alteromonas pelagimontana]